jgi:hypothetical protein
MADETYTAERVRELAVDLGGSWQFFGVVLKRGETAWNPASTKGPLYGPSLVEYRMHYTGIEVHEEDLTVECMGGDRIDEWPFWKTCQDDREAGTTRCTKHTPKATASA